MADNDQDPFLDDQDDDEQQPLDPLQPPGWPKTAPQAAQGSNASGYPNLPDDQALAVPQQRNATSHVSALGPPPTMPKPNVWQRLGAAALGGIAGYQNVSAGYPGHSKTKLDPTQAIQGIFGVPAYQRQAADWSNRVKVAEYQDTQDEKAHEADVRDQEAKSRIALSQAQMQDLALQRRARAQLYDQQAQANQVTTQDRWMRDKQIALPTQLNLNPTLEDDMQADALPGADPSAVPDSAGVPDISKLPLRHSNVPLNAAITAPPTAETPGGYSAVPMLPSLASQYPPGSQAYQASSMEQTAEKARQAAQLRSQYMPNKAPTTTELNIRAGGGTTGNAIVDAMTPDAADKARQSQANQPLQLTPEQQAAYAQGPDATGRRTALLNTLDPIMRNNVQQLLDARAEVTPYQLARAPEWAHAADYANMIDPQWDRSTYNLRLAGRKSFTSGPDAKNLASLNTLSGHIDTMINDMSALQNGDNRAVNSISNWLHNTFGTPQVNNAQAAATAVSGELATALKGNATDVEIGHWMDSIKPNMSPDQIAGVKKTLLDIMWRRLNEQDWKYQSIPGMQGQHPQNLISPNTAAILKGAGYDVDSLISKRVAGASPSAGAGAGAKTFIDGGKTYAIPAEKVQAFVASHPNAKAQ